MFMGTQANTFGSPVAAVFQTDNIKQDVDLFTARINYRFGGPIVARY
jgi:outer membrane immunogenic protein